MSRLPITSAITQGKLNVTSPQSNTDDSDPQVVEYCLACRHLHGPTRYNPEEMLCVKIKSLLASDGSQTDNNYFWYQVRVTLLCAAELACDVSQFLRGPECHLRTCVTNSQSLDNKCHLHVTCPKNGSCQVTVRGNTVSIASIDKEETARGINFKFRVFMRSTEMVSECGDLIIYLHRLQTVHAMILIKHAVEIPGFSEEFSLANRFPARDKMALLRVVTNITHYTSLEMEKDRVPLKCSCPHVMMPLRLINSNQDVHFRLTVVAGILPPPSVRLVQANLCGRIKVLLFGPGGVPLLLPHHVKFVRKELSHLLNLNDYGLRATMTEEHRSDTALSYDSEYILSDYESSDSDPPSEADPDRPYTIQMFFVFDRWNPSSKCDVMTLLDAQETLRLNLNHLLLSCRCKIRKTIHSLLTKIVTSNDPERERRDKYEKAIGVISESVYQIASRSTNVDFRAKCLSTLDVTDCHQLQTELGKRLWDIACNKARVKPAPTDKGPEAVRHLVATFDNQGALRSSQSTQGTQSTVCSQNNTGRSLGAENRSQVSAGREGSQPMAAVGSMLQASLTQRTDSQSSAGSQLTPESQSILHFPFPPQQSRRNAVSQNLENASKSVNGVIENGIFSGSVNSASTRLSQNSDNFRDREISYTQAAHSHRDPCNINASQNENESRAIEPPQRFHSQYGNSSVRASFPAPSQSTQDSAEECVVPQRAAWPGTDPGTGVMATSGDSTTGPGELSQSSEFSTDFDQLLAAYEGEDVSIFHHDHKKRPHSPLLSDDDTDFLMQELNAPKRRKLEDAVNSVVDAEDWISNIVNF